MGALYVNTEVLDRIESLLVRVADKLDEKPIEKPFVDDVLTSKQAAKYLKISERTLQTLRNNGSIKFIKGTKKITLLRVDLDAYLKSRCVIVNKTTKV